MRFVSSTVPRKCNSRSSNDDSTSTNISNPTKLPTGSDGFPEVPANMCCMSGCANCVWLDYAEDMVKAYTQKGQHLELSDIMKEVDANVDDPMIKAFIQMELKSKFVFNNKTGL